MKYIAVWVCLILAGCTSYTQELDKASLKESVFRFTTAANEAGMTAEETARLDQTVRAVPTTALRLAVIEPGAYYEPLKAEAVERHLRHRGFPPEAIVMVSGQMPQSTMSVRIRYRETPTVASCRVWPDEGQWNQYPVMDTRMGCSNAANLRAQVADARDLLLPQTSAGAEVETAVRAIGIYNSTLPATAAPSSQDATESRTTEE